MEGAAITASAVIPADIAFRIESSIKAFGPLGDM
jgi:hypothetical protein